MKNIVGASLVLLLLAGNATAQTPPSAPDVPPAVAKMMGDAPRPAGPMKSARFRLQVGHIFLGLTCPDDEPLKVCADFAMQLLDKAEAMQKH